MTPLGSLGTSSLPGPGNNEQNHQKHYNNSLLWELPPKMRWKQGIRRVRESLVREAEWVGWEEIPGQGLSFSKGPDRQTTLDMGCHRYWWWDSQKRNPELPIPSSEGPQIHSCLTDMPAAAAHLSVNSQQCWALWFRCSNMEEEQFQKPNMTVLHTTYNLWGYPKTVTLGSHVSLKGSSLQMGSK